MDPLNFDVIRDLVALAIDAIEAAESPDENVIDAQVYLFQALALIEQAATDTDK